jgi:hypothetical protein
MIALYQGPDTEIICTQLDFQDQAHLREEEDQDGER